MIFLGFTFTVTWISWWLLSNLTQVKPVYFFITAFLVSIVLGGIEEIGWRGILQPSLTRQLNLLVINFIIGIIWALWHLPLFYLVGAYHQGNSFFLFALAGIGYSSFLTWLYAKTNSIFLCVLFHAAINVTASIGFSVSMVETAVYFYSAVFVFVSGILFLLLLPKYSKKLTQDGMKA